MDKHMFDNMKKFCLTLQTQICSELSKRDTQSFINDSWTRPEGGGGLTCILENGSFIERGGVNTSIIDSCITTDSESEMFSTLLRHNKINVDASDLKGTPFSVTGISLVIHPLNPFVPTVHANFRYFEMTLPNKKVWWFGGGADLTPYYLFEEDASHFHTCFKAACDTYSPTYYPDFKAYCDRYFYLPHRKETRGIGGLFFDYMMAPDQETIFAFIKDFI